MRLGSSSRWAGLAAPFTQVLVTALPDFHTGPTAAYVRSSSPCSAPSPPPVLPRTVPNVRELGLTRVDIEAVRFALALFIAGAEEVGL